MISKKGGWHSNVNELSKHPSLKHRREIRSYCLRNSLQELLLSLDPHQRTEGWYLNVDES